MVSPTPNRSQDQALKELQDRTLDRILSVCPQPSLVLINLIAAQMDLPTKRIWEFFNEQKRGKSSAAKKLVL